MPKSCVRGKWSDEKRKEGSSMIREYSRTGLYIMLITQVLSTIH